MDSYWGLRQVGGWPFHEFTSSVCQWLGTHCQSLVVCVLGPRHIFWQRTCVAHGMNFQHWAKVLWAASKPWHHVSLPTGLLQACVVDRAPYEVSTLHPIRWMLCKGDACATSSWRCRSQAANQFALLMWCGFVVCWCSKYDCTCGKQWSCTIFMLMRTFFHGLANAARQARVETADSWENLHELPLPD